MIINWYGQTCFKITSAKSKDGQVVILIDPDIKESGLRGPKLEADIVLFTDGGKAISGSYFLVDGPGEYEIKEVYIKGVSVPSKETPQNIIYTFEVEEIKICHLGKLNKDELITQELEKIGDVDILMIPVGDKDSLDAKSAIKIMSQIEPKITIPMYYHIAGVKQKIEGVDKFLKALGIKNLAPLPKLSIKRKEIPEEEAKIVVLTA